MVIVETEKSTRALQDNSQVHILQVVGGHSGIWNLAFPTFWLYRGLSCSGMWPVLALCLNSCVLADRWPWQVFFSFFFFLVVWEFELRAWRLQVLYHLICTASPFKKNLFFRQVSHFLPGLASEQAPPTFASSLVYIIEVDHTLNCWLRWSLINFTLSLALNCDPPNLCRLSSWDYRCSTMSSKWQVFER
jgi:hypothetical protein